MKITVESGDITRQDAGAIIVNLFQGVTSPGGATGAVDEALDGGISALIAEGEIKGKKGEAPLVHSLGRIPSPRVIVAGLGKRESFDLNVIRNLMGTALRRARMAGAKTVATIVHGAGIAGLETAECAQAVAEGAIMGEYRFRKYKNNDDLSFGEIETLTIVESDKRKIRAIERGVERGRTMAEAANHTRNMANEPGNELPPVKLADRAARLCREAGIECEILDDAQLKKLGMGALLGVGVGSARRPRFIIMRYRGDKRTKKTMGLLGKGITFDSGGISIKPAAGMEAMKGDMSGGAAVISTIRALG